MAYFVSRQIVWPDGTPVVEIAGCLDMAGPDMLVPAYKRAGDGCEYDDPREAAEAAIRVRDLWWTAAKDGQLKDWKKVGITYQGSVLAACGDEFETDFALLEWAEKRFEKITKCAECGGPIYDKNEAYYPEGCHGDEAFLCCRAYCAEKHNTVEDDETAERADDPS